MALEISILPNRKTGLDIIGDVSWGTHFCQFYKTKEDLIDILVPYFKAGLENNEFCMWVTSTPLDENEAEKALRKVVPDFYRYKSKGQIEIIPYTEWYVKGGTFDADRVLNGWVGKLNQALAKGFDGLRLTGNTFWLEKSEWKDFSDYEGQVDAIIGNHKMIAICTYSLDKCGATELVDVVRNHQFAIIKNEGRWDFIESSELKQTKEALKQSKVALWESEEKYKGLFTSMHEGAALHEIVYDDNGQPVDYIIKEVNPRYESILGIDREQAIDQRATALYGTEQAPHIEIYSQVAEAGEPVKFETYFPPVEKHFSISVFSPTKGQFATIFSDITESKQRELLNTTLNEINAAISSTLDFDKIVQKVFVDGAEALGAEASAVVLRQGDYWVTQYINNFPAKLLGLRLSADQAADLEYLTRTKKVVIVEDTSTDKSIDYEFAREVLGVKSSIVLPLLVKGEVVGILAFAHLSNMGAFNEAQIDFADALAISVSFALENASLYEAERNIADTLQEALLMVPEHIDGVEFGYLYCSATETARVGGDFYDIFEIEHGKVGIVIGDVSGKGIEAAALTAVVKNTIKAHAYGGGTPASIIAKTNDLLVRTLTPSNFVTVFFGILDTKTAKLSYCSAGHPPAIIRRKTGNIELLDKHSPLIGAFPSQSYRSAKISLHDGDNLILYTDGIIEVRCGGRIFGEEGLVWVIENLEPIPVEQFPQAIFNNIMGCSGGQLSDDVAVLTVSLASKDDI